MYLLDDDLMPGLTSDQKKVKLARISYADYLSNLVKVDPKVVSLLQAYPQSLYGVGIDAVSAQDAWDLGMPGFAGLKLAPGAGARHGPRLHPERRGGGNFSFIFLTETPRSHACWCVPWSRGRCRAIQQTIS